MDFLTPDLPVIQAIANGVGMDLAADEVIAPFSQLIKEQNPKVLMMYNKLIVRILKVFVFFHPLLTPSSVGSLSDLSSLWLFSESTKYRPHFQILPKSQYAYNRGRVPIRDPNDQLFSIYWFETRAGRVSENM